ncbi:MAG: DUF465 domain-containing protein [Hyphomicrobiaceae bacterium]|nr:DUF465 domain-containing protein [Hyphomicrobiaceae bacterium]
MLNNSKRFEMEHIRLNMLREEHSNLGEIVLLLENANGLNQLQVKRLKKQRFALKTAIENLEDRLCPDIIA